eukprot:2815119-Prymnesium_polylepis.1
MEAGRSPPCGRRSGPSAPQTAQAAAATLAEVLVNDGSEGLTLNGFSCEATVNTRVKTPASSEASNRRVNPNRDLVYPVHAHPYRSSVRDTLCEKRLTATTTTMQLSTRPSIWNPRSRSRSPHSSAQYSAGTSMCSVLPGPCPSGTVTWNSPLPECTRKISPAHTPSGTCTSIVTSSFAAAADAVASGGRARAWQRRLA